jgi:hypothetical protein
MMTISAAIVGGLIFAAPSVSAHMNGIKGGIALADKAQILGMSEEELKKELTSKNLLQIAKEKGLDQQALDSKIREQYEQKLKDDKLSSEEIQSRMKRWNTWRKIHSEVREQKLKSIASAIGKSVDELKNERETKSMRQILQENGLIDSSDSGKRSQMHGME